MHDILIRHEMAGGSNTWSGDKYSLPLAKEGITKIQLTIEGLKTIGITPTRLLSSSLTRTHQTASIAKNIFKI